jgi:hypothetical protein
LVAELGGDVADEFRTLHRCGVDTDFVGTGPQ